MNIKFGMSEMMIIFATALLWHNTIAAGCVFAFAAFCGFCRWAVDYTEKAKKAEASKEAVKMLNEQAGDLGEALGELFGGLTKKNKMNMH